MGKIRSATYLLVFLCGMLSLCCGNENSNPLESGIFPESKDAFIGLWNGEVDGRLTFQTMDGMPQDYHLDDMHCRLAFTLFKYELVMQEYRDGRETIYRQTGDWAWSDQNPRMLVFYDDSVSLSQIVSLKDRIVRGTSFGSPAGKWTCEATFTDADLSDLKLSGFNPQLRLLDPPENVLINISK